MTVNASLTDLGTLQVQRGLAAMTFSPEEAVALLGHLVDLLPRITAPELQQGEGGNLICPHCDQIHVPGTGDGPVVEVDADTRRNGSYSWLSGDPHVSISQGEINYSTMVFLTTCCGRVVSIPGEVSVTWS